MSKRKHLLDLSIKPVPVPPGYDHPGTNMIIFINKFVLEPPNPVLPKHEFTMGLIA